MRKIALLVMLLVVGVTACSKSKQAPPEDPAARWFSSPAQVVEGIMYAYQTRNDSLYAAFLAENFHYYFEPAGGDSNDVLGWGKEEEVVATGNLFRTPDVDSLSFHLMAGNPRPAPGPGRAGWMVVPVSGGEMRVIVRNKEPMEVTLNRQEIVLRPVAGSESPRWEIVEWHDYPAPDLEGGE